jgi:hypothetical protein
MTLFRSRFMVLEDQFKPRRKCRGLNPRERYFE